MKIHISPHTYEMLKKYSEYAIQERGQIQIKGKGMMTTYWLEGREEKTLYMPDPWKGVYDTPLMPLFKSFTTQ